LQHQTSKSVGRFSSFGTWNRWVGLGHEYTLDWRFSKIIEPVLPLTNRSFTNIKKKNEVKEPTLNCQFFCEKFKFFEILHNPEFLWVLEILKKPNSDVLRFRKPKSNVSLIF
jgi:hypothetical protein